MVGVWAGNSNSTQVSSPSDPIFSLDAAAPVWQNVMREVSRGWQVNNFRRPDGIGEAEVRTIAWIDPSTLTPETTHRLLWKALQVAGLIAAPTS